MFLLDTNTVSRLFKNDSVVRQHFQQCSPLNIFVSVIVEAELRYGVAKNGLEQSKRGKLVEDFIANMRVLPWTSVTAKCFAKLRANSEKNGITVATVDVMIAAQAQEHDLTLVTNNKAMHNLNPWLRVVNWTV